METIIILLLLLLFGVGAPQPGPTFAPPPLPTTLPTPAPGMMHVDHVVQDVQIVTTRSIPAQVNVSVSGYVPDGCVSPRRIDLARVGNTFTIHIYRELPADTGCGDIVIDFNETIVLAERLTIGDGPYTIIVNGVSQTLP